MVAEYMVHGTCGKHNPMSSCMKNGRCSKNYPKEFHEKTTVDEKMILQFIKDRTTKDLLLKLTSNWIITR
jgi:hypothetical protein